jgi:hypothetical protein
MKQSRIFEPYVCTYVWSYYDGSEKGSHDSSFCAKSFVWPGFIIRPWFTVRSYLLNFHLIWNAFKSSKLCFRKNLSTFSFYTTFSEKLTRIFKLYFQAYKDFFLKNLVKLAVPRQKSITWWFVKYVNVENCLIAQLRRYLLSASQEGEPHRGLHEPQTSPLIGASTLWKQ